MTTLAQDQPESFSRQTAHAPTLTVETMLYAAFFLIALILRLFMLDHMPLDANEARQALSSWNFIHAVPDSFTGSSVLFVGNSILFLLFGASDAVARILPVVAGSLLVLIPGLLRSELGRPGALVASVLLVFSPSLVLFSRQADGAILGVTFGLFAVACASRYLENHASPESYLAAISFALALLSSSQVWTMVLALALFVLIARLLRETWSIDKDDARNALVLFALVFIGVATVFMFRREGLGAAFNLFGTWLDALRLNPMPIDPLRLLVLYEPITLFFGVIAVVDILFSARSMVWHRTLNHGLMVWAVVAFVLYSFTGDAEPARVITVVVPLALIAGWFIGAWLSRLVEAVRYAPEAKIMILGQETPVFLLALALAIFLSIVIAEFTLRGNLASAESLLANLRLSVGAGNAGLLIVLILCILVIAAIVFLALTTLGFERSGYLGIVLALTLMGAWTFRQSMMLNFTMRPNVFEWLTPHTASPNARDLVRDVENLSRWRANDSHSLALVVDDSLGAMAAWNLRGFRNARFVMRPRADTVAPAMLLPVNAPAPAGWIGQEYALELVQGVGPTTGVLRWLLYRDVGATQTIGAVLWTPPSQ